MIAHTTKLTSQIDDRWVTAIDPHLCFSLAQLRELAAAFLGWRRLR
ncbi:hypothetical protein KOR42_06210 [Thalassoglobus neptunius]|uniref:Uncharacterized protein n=1 Tax=Thalassoglobus neptunius TaxID=1938619 RepID=A0A5C5X4V0_9PLAN|nr:hypothetical protein KOR42_06210 [Thalassoglobus neptunius]